jgi:hypothetical protein
LSRRKAISEGHLYKGAAFVYDAVALPTNDDIGARFRCGWKGWLLDRRRLDRGGFRVAHPCS